jgi:lysophospholipase L1-like esterase
MPGIDMAETRFTTNAIGLRGREMPPPGTPRWIAVGGSSTESLFLDDADAWTAVLERELREKHGRDLWLGNAGKSGLTTFSHVSELLAYEEEIAPSLVIMQAGFNDMSLCISGGRQDVIDTALRFRHADYPAAYGRFVFHEIRPPGAASRWRLEALVDRVRERYENEAAAAPERAFVVQDNAASFYRVLRQRRQEAAKVDAAPVLDDCLRAYAANLRRIADWAEARKVRLVMLTQGSLYRDGITPADETLLWFGSVDESFFNEPPPKRYFGVRTMREILGRYNAAMLEVCTERRLWCYDVDTFVPQTSAAYYDDAHVNVQGARMLGAELAKRLDAAIAANGGY